MSKHIVSFVLLMLFSFFGVGQNLVPNGGFENINPNFNEKPNIINGYKIITDWMPASTGHPDVFHPRHTLLKHGKEGNNYTSIMGHQMPHTGVGYAGLGAFSTFGFKEYFQVKLRGPLTKGEEYYFEMYVAACDHDANHATSNFGAAFSPKPLTKENIEKRTPQIINPLDRYIENTKGWMKVSGRFIADGTERVLTLGNFTPVENTQILPAPTEKQQIQIYMYVDDVFLIESSKLPDFKNLISEGKIDLNTIRFKSGSAEILSSSFVHLNQFVSFLRFQDELHIKIIGHTDNEGSESYNKSLSEKRAKSVMGYLIKEGVSSTILSSEGQGESKPLVPNDTKKGKAKNRRVEFRIDR